MSASPDDLLSEGSLNAAVTALVERNRHHFEAMSEAERTDAVGHWRDLATSVLAAAGAALHQPAGASADPNAPGRAVVVFEDAGGDQVAVHASFYPELEDLGNGEVAGTPAQATALELLQNMADVADEEPGGG